MLDTAADEEQSLAVVGFGRAVWWLAMAMRLFQRQSLFQRAVVVSDEKCGCFKGRRRRGVAVLREVGVVSKGVVLFVFKRVCSRSIFKLCFLLGEEVHRSGLRGRGGSSEGGKKEGGVPQREEGSTEEGFPQRRSRPFTTRSLN